MSGNCGSYIETPGPYGVSRIVTIIAVAADALRTPTESQLEYERAEVLQATAGVLESYRSQHGKLPEVIPNPAYGAVVGYERLDNYRYILSAKHNSVTLEMVVHHSFCKF